MKDLIEQYYKKLEEIKLLRGVSALLSWDQENQMPKKAIEERAKQSSAIESLVHKKFTDKEFKDIVYRLYENFDKLSPIEKRSIYLTKKDLDKRDKLPPEFVEEFAKEKSLAGQAWIEAKTKENFAIFKPNLAKIFDLTKKYAEYIDSSKPIYDVLLDDYEEGMKTEELNKIFAALRKDLTEILPQIKQKKPIGVLQSTKFDKDTARKLISEMAQKIGFDVDRGALGEVHHPFETRISDNDIRINVKYPENDIAFSITSAIHELGHGLYEQNINPEYFKTDFGEGRSLAIHESQSRLLENMIGRGQSFWKHFMPLIQTYFPELSKFNFMDVYNDINVVKPSFIRTEADEVTYNLHIILRFEIEQMVLNNEIKIEDIPEIWDSKIQEFLGVIPEKISQGCLQDVHWSMGGIGYFPTYALGNLAAAQLWNQFRKENPDYETRIGNGDFSVYFNWFREKIWEHGAFYTAEEFLKNVTGESLTHGYFVEYVKQKYVV